MKGRWYFSYNVVWVHSSYLNVSQLIIDLHKGKHAITTLRNLANFAKFFAGMSLKKSGRPFKFPGRLNFTHRTAQTAFVRVVTPRERSIFELLIFVQLSGVESQQVLGVTSVYPGV